MSPVPPSRTDWPFDVLFLIVSPLFVVTFGTPIRMHDLV